MEQPRNDRATPEIPASRKRKAETPPPPDDSIPSAQLASLKEHHTPQQALSSANGHNSLVEPPSPDSGRPSYSTDDNSSTFDRSDMSQAGTSSTSLGRYSPPYQQQHYGHGGSALDDADEDRDEAEEHAAVEQAEEGSIVVDSDDVGSDAGYETDTHTSGSTSLADSVRDYIYENGRRYHKFREGRYNFPNDDIEQQREDMKHTMVKMLCGQLYFAPIGKSPQQILDIGTGTGIWAIEMGDEFESATVLGIDLSPIQPEWVPPNVRFMVDDVESPWLHNRNFFDYIHSRHTVMAIKDWPKLMRRALEHLRPGGWFEMQEVHHFPISANKSMPPEHPVAQYWSLINQGLGNLGINFYACANGNLANMMRENGFVNVTERVLQIPIGTWPKNKVLKTVGLYWRTILTDGIQAIALGPLTRGCGWSPQDVEILLMEVRKAYKDNSSLMYMPLHIIYGQKPPNY
ncbi:S-adenosyl-L-methionine-dependent methyltransferase [Podospora australis]|uniref:S-adenosyl-L-methionine-dependent methyltransferase n=1 Tax=Podospora australis TaxID=1536484 RepID=A0AAN6X3F1_9PEZI|nr:S-adenosyl-L-methionine-dependent methyltransferase [Podospora australis]